MEPTMSSVQTAIETAIRTTITKGVVAIAGYNRAHAKTAKPHPYLTGIHSPMTEELTLQNLPVSGSIPATLNGRYLRIGPNPAGTPNPARYHWFTGDGMVHGVRIENGRATWYRNRWVRTSRVSRLLGEPPAPGPRLFESAVNTNIIGHAGRTYALVEAGGTPVELDGTLTTIAHNNFDGTLAHAFSAHPHRDPATGELHAICYHATDLTHVYHTVVDAAGKVIREEPIAVAHGPSIHDCAITARFVIILDLPVTFSTSAMLAGYEFPYRWNPEHRARIGLLPRHAAGTDTIWCDIEPCYVYHPCNAYDDENGNVILDVAVHDKNSFRDYRGPDAEQIKFERWIVNPLTREVTRTVLDDTPQEFPRFDERRTGQNYRYAYALEIPPKNEGNLIGGTSIIKHDLQTCRKTQHDFGAGNFPGEFVFIPATPDSAEDDGILMGLVVNTTTETTDLVLLNAADIAAEPVARIHLPHRIPPGFHGNWVPNA
jgi:carotenoid cleavage dioxygenase